jgi:hypothetical protein
MKTTKPKPRPVSEIVSDRNTFVARLILAEAISKRGHGPLAPRRNAYTTRKR